MQPTNNILVIGKPKTGKTTFFAQLYMRAQKRKGVVTLLQSPSSIKAIDDAISRLTMGEETQSTPAESNEELIFPVVIESRQMDLVCPDYGGEQVNSIVELMEYHDNWKQRALGSDHWILFVRPGVVVNYYDLSNAGYEELNRRKSEGQLQSPLSEQCQLIELLQALLYIKGIGTKQRIVKPSLLVALTCWDELDNPTLPAVYMQKVLPLLYDFINANWMPGAFKVCGLSAQGFSLHDEENKDRYLDEMPESFGYLVAQDGSTTDDITQLIKEAIQ